MSFNWTVRFFVIVLFLLVGFNIVNAQQAEHCGTVAAQQRLLQKDTGLAARLAIIQQQLQQYTASNPGQHQRSVITIPVVVHVVHNGEAVGTGTNISDAQVRSELVVLNNDYRKLNADTGNIPAAFKSLAADFEIEFCLAVRSPSGQATNGIDRVNGHQSSWTETDVDNILKPGTIWSASQYLNIWTVKLGGASASILGYAIPPGNDSTIDGVVIGYQYFGNTGNVIAPYNKGRTATHEIGHWLGLSHVWSQFGDPATADCNDDDGIGDTPKQSKANYGCPSFPHVSCSNGPNGDMFMDYMDYTDDGCMNMFTQGQKTLALATMNTLRSSIKNSQGCLRYGLDVALVEARLPSTQVCDGNFRPVVRISNEGITTLTSCNINSILDAANILQYSWTGNLEAGESELVTIDAISTTAGAHSIQLFANGPNGRSDQNPSNDEININFTVLGNSAGNSLPVVEGFEGSTSLPSGWTKDSVGADNIRWSVTDSTGYNSNSSVWINNFAGTSGTNSRGKRDYLIVAPLFIPFGKYPHLTFDVAYSRKDSNSQDGLTVAYSIDCGANWFEIYSKRGEALRTAETTATAFKPTAASEWRHEDIGMEDVTGQDHVLIRFENYSDWGNNIYLDNINIDEGKVGINELSVPTINATIAPNPSTGKFVATFDRELPQHSTIEVFDLIGRQVYHNSGVSGNAFEIDLSGTDAGMYLVKVSSGASSVVKKVVVQ